jgi:PBP1b-binding outer membrane lipoprotein LpoB
MKKLFALLVVAGMVFISCNPKTEEAVAEEATTPTEEVAPATTEEAAPVETPAETPAETQVETPAE